MLNASVIILEGALGDVEGVAYLQEANLPGIRRLVADGSIFRIERRVTESEFFGLNPEFPVPSQGVLLVAALGYDPPDRSVHFQVDLMSCGSDGVLAPCGEVHEEELEEVIEFSKKLNTSKLTLLEGVALVWEDGSRELETVAPREGVGNLVRFVLPIGEKENYLRRFIDDSVNLLNEMPLNRRRADEGLPLLNILWPWGQGARGEFPNLPLRYGRPLTLSATSMRMKGFGRLLGFKPAMGKSDIFHHRFSHPNPEETIFELRAFDERLQTGRLCLIMATGEEAAICVLYDRDNLQTNPYPFDERTITDDAVAKVDLAPLIRRVLTDSDSLKTT